MSQCPNLLPGPCIHRFSDLIITLNSRTDCFYKLSEGLSGFTVLSDNDVMGSFFFGTCAVDVLWTNENRRQRLFDQ